MNRKIILPVIVVMSFFVSCAKNTSNGNNSWFFKSVNYSTSTCLETGATMTANNQSAGNNSTYSTLSLTFNTSGAPTSPGFYRVVPYAGFTSGTNEVLISLYTNGTAQTAYNSTGTAGQTIAVEIIAGKIIASGQGIMLSSYSNPSDSSQLNFDLQQSN